MTVSSTIEIAAPPDLVRAKFLDFSNMKTYHTSFFASIVPLTTLTPGEKIRVTFAGNYSMDAEILVNEPKCFTWAGRIPYVFGGDHSFHFTPSSTTPGGTTFTQKESFYSTFGFLLNDNFVGRRMGYREKTAKNWDKFNEDLKRACEAEVKK